MSTSAAKSAYAPAPVDADGDNGGTKPGRSDQGRSDQGGSDQGRSDHGRCNTGELSRPAYPGGGAAAANRSTRFLRTIGHSCASTEKNTESLTVPSPRR